MNVMPIVDLSENGTGPQDQPSGQNLSQAEKRRRHDKVVRFFDSGDYVGMSLSQIAQALGVTNETVRNEARKRGVYTPHVPTLSAQRVPITPPKPKLPPGAAEKRMDQFFADYPGGMFTIIEISEMTGLNKDSVRSVLNQRGMTSERPAGASRSVFGKYQVPDGAGKENPVPAPSEAGQAEPEQEDNGLGITYVGRNSEGRLIAAVKGTDVLWTLKLDRPL